MLADVRRIAINSQAPFGRPIFYSRWLPERPVQTTLIQRLSSRLRHKAKRSSAHVVAASCSYSTRLLAATASIRDFCGMSPPHATRIHGFTCKQRSTASLAGFWSCCHFPTTAADSCAGSFGPGRRSFEDVAWESVYAGMKPTLYMRWKFASERPSPQAGATAPLQWMAIVIAIGL